MALYSFLSACLLRGTPICSRSCMRRREQVASSKDDNILTARKDGHTVSERLESCCNGLREFSGHLQMRRKPGSLPAVTLRGNQPDHRPIATATRRRATPHSPKSERASAHRISTHTDLEPRAKQPEHYKTEQALSGGKVHAANEHQSFVVNTISNHTGRNSKCLRK